MTASRAGRGRRISPAALQRIRPEAIRAGRAAQEAAFDQRPQRADDGDQIDQGPPAGLVAVVDAEWATVGSSNIDPLSLLLNLEANVIVRDAPFSAALGREIDAAVAASREVTAAETGGRVNLLRRGFVAWCMRIFLRIAGATGRY